MIRNDYRRALIMLRGLDKNMTGHVRLERRTQMGSFQFTISGAPPGAQLSAALLARSGGRWRGAKLGMLGRDSRGQAGLNASFDPRNIEGLTLEQYPLLVIVSIENGAPRLAMCGNVNGSVDMDWAQVHAAAVKLFSEGEKTPQPAVEVPAAIVPVPVPDMVAEVVEEIPVSNLPDQAYVEPTKKNCPLDKIEPYAEAALIEADAQVSAFDAAVEEVMVPVVKDVPLLVLDAAEEKVMASASDPDGIIAVETPVIMAMSMDDVARAGAMLNPAIPAGLLLDLDITERWPDSIEPLRGVFLREPPFRPFDDPGYVYVETQLPGAMCVGRCAVGIRCEMRKPVAVSYGIPGSFEPENPAGMEDYRWIGEGSSGWWVIHLDAATGDIIE